jgi:hypothetical protein
MPEEQQPQPQEFVVQGTLRLNSRVYQHGAEITLSDPALIAELREAHAIATRFEVTPPAVLQTQHEQVVSENADLRARLAELEAQINGQSGQDGQDGQTGADASEADATPKSNG